MSDFQQIKAAVATQFAKLVASGGQFFTTTVSKDALWDTYLGKMSKELNPIYKERTEHDCNCCKSFIRRVGGIVVNVDGELQSIWDIKIEGEYQHIADELSALVKSHPIRGIFLSEEKHAGQDHTYQITLDGGTKRWDHFHQELPAHLVSDEKGALVGKANNNFAVLKRSILEISTSAVEDTLSLIDGDQLYRGAEMKRTVVTLRDIQTEYFKLNNSLAEELFIWKKSAELGEYSSIRNTAIGTLLVDLSDGTELVVAVNKYGSKMDGYKVCTSLVTGSQVAAAEKLIIDMGMGPSLPRRPAVTEDLTINNVLFADRSAKDLMGVGLASLLGGVIKVKPADPKQVIEIGIEDFMKDILPTADTLEAMLNNGHEGNFVSLIAPVNADAPNMLQWDNNFSWSYKGEAADSMRARVAELGGRVDGTLRFTHTWNEDGQNQSLMDLWCYMPGSTIPSGHPDRPNQHTHYHGGRRVSWNHRSDKDSGGGQDVDHVNAPGTEVPVENITFPDRSRMPEGVYTFRINNYAARTPNKSGGRAEIEFDGQIFKYDYPQAIPNQTWITLAEVTLKNGQFTIEHKLPHLETTKQVWGVDTMQFRKVEMVMLSPNFWDENEAGNKHYFFMLDGCKNPDSARGFYNEFLRKELHEHRKVFQHISSKMVVEPSDNQLCGVGFSSTLRNELLVKVTNANSRIYKIKF